jgi:hypothetical protein
MNEFFRMVAGWIKEGVITVALIFIMISVFLVSSAYPQHGRAIIKHFAPIVKEHIPTLQSSYEPPPGFITAGAPPGGFPTKGDIGGVF